MSSSYSFLSKPLLSGVVFGVAVLGTAFAASTISSITSGSISSGDTMAAGWYQQVNDRVVPSGAVMSFNLATCPTGWSEYTQAAGRTVIGAGSGANTTSNVGDIGGDKNTPTITGSVSVKGLSVQTSWGYNLPNSTNNVAGRVSGSSATFFAPNASDIAFPAASFTAGGTAPDNMQPYVALLYCQKN